MVLPRASFPSTGLIKATRGIVCQAERSRRNSTWAPSTWKSKAGRQTKSELSLETLKQSPPLPPNQPPLLCAYKCTLYIWRACLGLQLFDEASKAARLKTMGFRACRGQCRLRVCFTVMLLRNSMKSCGATGRKVFFYGAEHRHITTYGNHHLRKWNSFCLLKLTNLKLTLPNLNSAVVRELHSESTLSEVEG